MPDIEVKLTAKQAEDITNLITDYKDRQTIMNNITSLLHESGYSDADILAILNNTDIIDIACNKFSEYKTAYLQNIAYQAVLDTMKEKQFIKTDDDTDIKSEPEKPRKFRIFGKKQKSNEDTWLDTIDD